MDRNKVINEFEHLLNYAKGNHQNFVNLNVDGAEKVLALMKEQEDKIVYLQERGDRALDNLQVVLKERLQDDRE